MKKNHNTGYIVCLALMLTLFSVTVAAQEFIITYGGEGSWGFTDLDMKPFEIDVKERKAQIDGPFAKIKNLLQIAEYPHPAVVAISIEPNEVYIMNEHADGYNPARPVTGAYIKVTDPKGRVILDKSTPETGYVAYLNGEWQEFGFDNPIPGKYTVWSKLVNANNGIVINCRINIYPKK